MLEHEPGSTAPSVADLYEKGVSSGSMSKSYSLAGLRTGWVVGPGEVIQLKVALSYVSAEGARLNLDAELNHWDFQSPNSFILKILG